MTDPTNTPGADDLGTGNAPVSSHHASGALEVVVCTPLYAVIIKPSGLLSVPGKGPEKQDCAATRVRAMFPDATGPLVVHRLDMETSGLLVFGLTPDAQRELSRQFEARQTEKAYITALLDGLLDRDEGEVSLPIRPDIDRRPYQIVDYVHGRPSVTRFRVLSRETDQTRVRFEPVTGRAHQLRVHSAISRDQGGLGCPILGDPLYGSKDSAERLMLHAAELTFLDPDTGRRIECVSRVPF